SAARGRSAQRVRVGGGRALIGQNFGSVVICNGSRPSSAGHDRTNEGWCPVSGVIYKVLILVLSLALGISVTTSVRTRQEMQAMTASNETLRKTLGDMSIAITDREKDI